MTIGPAELAIIVFLPLVLLGGALVAALIFRSARGVLRKQTDACPHCGRRVPADGRFCPYCGRALS